MKKTISRRRPATTEMSGVVVNPSGDLQPDYTIEVNQQRLKAKHQRRIVSIITISLASVNIGIEAALQILEALGKIEHRGMVLSTVGIVLVAVCFSTIPIRNKWTMKINAAILILYTGYCIVQL